MQSITTLLLLLISALSSLAAPSRNLTSLASADTLPYPSGFSMKNCPADSNAWTNSQSQSSPKSIPRSFAIPKDNRLINDENSMTRLHPGYSVAINPPANSKRQQRVLCNSIARQHFNYNGIESSYPTVPILLKAGIQYVISFSSNNPVLGATVWQAAVGSALNHMVSHPSFARSARGTLTFTLKQAANVWVLLKFATGMPAQGDLAIFALNTPSELNIEAGSGGL